MLEALLKRLKDRDARKREAAVRELAALPPDTLLELADLEEKAQIKASRKAVRSLGLTLALALLDGCCFFLPSENAKTIVGILFVALWIKAVFQVGFLCNFDAPLRWTARNNIQQAMLQHDDPRFLGAALAQAQTLLMAPSHLKKKSNRQTLENLKRRLLEMRASDRPQMAPHLQGMLRLLHSPQISPYTDVDLTLAILKALEQVGDSSTCGHIVQFLAEEPQATGNMLRVSRAARECLPYLRANVRQAEQAQTLLRASDASTVTTPQVLLRPAEPAIGTTPSEQLLRVAATRPAELTSQQDIPVTGTWTEAPSAMQTLSVSQQSEG